MTIRETFEAAPILGKGDWDKVEETVIQDVKRQAEAAGVQFFRYLPNMFRFGFIISNAEGTKWVQVSTADVREGVDWMDMVGLRRMKGSRDVKNDPQLYCVYERLGEACAEYLGDAFDE